MWLGIGFMLFNSVLFVAVHITHHDYLKVRLH